MTMRPAAPNPSIASRFDSGHQRINGAGSVSRDVR
jgi:hypothetical protein